MGRSFVQVILNVTMSMNRLTEPARLLLLASLLAKDRLISHNGKSFLKELILRKDPRLLEVFARFGDVEGEDTAFLSGIFNLIDGETRKMYQKLFAGFDLEVGKSLSKTEREQRSLTSDKSLIYGEVDFMSFAKILREVSMLVEPSPGGVFYDLGSGTGKAIFAVSGGDARTLPDTHNNAIYRL
ncbi:unnamed protein product [Choristocarpus tenellus]